MEPEVLVSNVEHVLCCGIQIAKNTYIRRNLGFKPKAILPKRKHPSAIWEYNIVACAKEEWRGRFFLSLAVGCRRASAEDTK